MSCKCNGNATELSNTSSKVKFYNRYVLCVVSNTSCREGERRRERRGRTRQVGNRVRQRDAEKVVQVASFSSCVLSSFGKKRRNDGGASASDAARGTWSPKGLKT